jgi:ferrous iron transport protein B
LIESAVSNYPGTTVEVARGVMRYRGREFTIIDSPGMYSLTPITDEERVARRILLRDRPDLVLHVVDAKNLARMLPLTVQLLETGAPVILVLNMMDELERAGLSIQVEAL